MIHLIGNSYKYYHRKYLFFLFLGLYSNTILGSRNNELLTKDQLQEKIDKYEEIIQKSHESSLYIARQLRDSTNTADSLHLVSTFGALVESELIIEENVKNLEEQMNAYDEGSLEINNNNQHNNSNNSHRRLHTQYFNMPLYLKIIIGIIVVTFISFMAILIWESLPNKKKKQTKKSSFPIPKKPKSA